MEKSFKNWSENDCLPKQKRDSERKREYFSVYFLLLRPIMLRSLLHKRKFFQHRTLLINENRIDFVHYD